MTLRLPRAVLFDNDGVLSASEPLHRAAIQDVCRTVGIPYNPDVIPDRVGGTTPATLTALLDHYKPAWRETHDLEKLVAQKNDTFLLAAQAGLATFEGVTDGLRWLRDQKIATACVSNARTRELRATLDLLGLTPYMDVLISREDAVKPKPDPTPYLMAAASLSVEPGDCFAVEDSPTGLAAALQARIPAFGIQSHYPESSLVTPIPGRPDLRTTRCFVSMAEFFVWMRGLG